MCAAAAKDSNGKTFLYSRLIWHVQLWVHVLRPCANAPWVVSTLSRAPLNIGQVYGVPDTDWYSEWHQEYDNLLFFLPVVAVQLTAELLWPKVRMVKVGRTPADQPPSTQIHPDPPRSTQIHSDGRNICRMISGVRTFCPDCTFLPVQQQHLATFGNRPSKWWDTTSVQNRSANVSNITSFECLKIFFEYSSVSVNKSVTNSDGPRNNRNSTVYHRVMASNTRRPGQPGQPGHGEFTADAPAASSQRPSENPTAGKLPEFNGGFDWKIFRWGIFHWIFDQRMV